MPTKKTKKNPNDATFRNINALKKRVEKLENTQRLHTKCIALHIEQLQRLKRK